MKKKRSLEEVLPIYKVENNCILSRTGDVTIAFEVTLPELFTLSIDDYEALHFTWVKAIRLLPAHSILHKQDWFVRSKYKSNFDNPDLTFLSRSSELNFNERPYYSHQCYLYLTKRSASQRTSSSLTSSLIKFNLSTEQSINNRELSEFMDKAGQFIKILEDCSFIKTRRLSTEELVGSVGSAGLIERYCFLLGKDEMPLIRDIDFSGQLKVGDLHTKIFTLADINDLPSLCGPRCNYEKYSTDKTKFSVSFAAPLGHLLNCNHIYNQYITINDVQQTLKKMESKRLRLHSLSAYSRENSLSRDAVNQFLNEAISQQRLPVKAHFNIVSWTDNKSQLKEIRNNISSSLAQMDAVAKEETIISPQLFFAGIPGGSGYLPLHETFDSFAEQASCFFTQETSYRSSLSPVGIRLGDRLSGIPIHVDISDEPILKGICTNRNKFILGPSLCRVIQ
ncbi:TraG family conjugative transposon ATPase [Chitinophaga niabensis]|uniref:TraG family conjugative transposon ATPase n=1 Tax=Chitinophaga niabensis TaxID=536979 RepID=UPI000A872B43|nr:TraG family conjugative transposon ATPase [Chitinophaga niabensis]